MDTEAGEVQSGNKEKICLGETSQALEEVSQRGCADSIHGGFQGVGGKTSQQLGLISRVTLPGAGGWGTDLLKPLPA